MTKYLVASNQQEVTKGGSIYECLESINKFVYIISRYIMSLITSPIASAPPPPPSSFSFNVWTVTRR